MLVPFMTVVNGSTVTSTADYFCSLYGVKADNVTIDNCTYTQDGGINGIASAGGTLTIDIII